MMFFFFSPMHVCDGQVLEEGAAAVPCGEPFVVCERENLSRAFVPNASPNEIAETYQSFLDRARCST